MRNAINTHRYHGNMPNRPDLRFNEGEIVDKILKAIEANENIIKKTVEILKEIAYYQWVGIYLVESVVQQLLTNKRLLYRMSPAMIVILRVVLRQDPRSLFLSSLPGRSLVR